MQTFTYYSYKGGTGRSLLLANTARYLALLGKKVVAVDFDLEAPGLHYKLNTSGPERRPGDEPPAKGVVDYLHCIATGDGKAPDLRDHLTAVPLPHGIEGSLHLMPAGAAPTGAYWRTLTTLLRQDFLTNPDGIAACLELQVRIEEDLEADFLLIDSGAGVTESAGLATGVLADKVICLMLPNRESQSGARAVLRSLQHAERLPNRPPLDIVPVLSRVPDQDDEVLDRVRRFLNEPGPTPEDTLSLDRLFVLRGDPESGRSGRPYPGTGETEGRPGSHQDYVTLMRHLVEADPEKIAAANRRQEAVRHTRRWLTENYGSHKHRSTGPKPFRADQLDEGVLFRRAHSGSALRGSGRREPMSCNDEERYADLVAYASEDRTEVRLAVEYVENLEESEAWIWWQDHTSLRCVVLVGTNGNGNPQRRVFTRGRPDDELVERTDSPTAASGPSPSGGRRRGR